MITMSSVFLCPNAHPSYYSFIIRVTFLKYKSGHLFFHTKWNYLIVYQIKFKFLSMAFKTSYSLSLFQTLPLLTRELMPQLYGKTFYYLSHAYSYLHAFMYLLLSGNIAYITFHFDRLLHALSFYSRITSSERSSMTLPSLLSRETCEKTLHSYAKYYLPKLTSHHWNSLFSWVSRFSFDFFLCLFLHSFDVHLWMSHYIVFRGCYLLSKNFTRL